jgi:predicted TIM-barrel fold metal-dependent hydrolase
MSEPSPAPAPTLSATPVPGGGPQRSGRGARWWGAAALALGALAVLAVVRRPSVPTPDALLLKDYRPHSIFKIPVTPVDRAKFPAIDIHEHDDGATDAEIQRWISDMDAVGIERSVLLASRAGKAFDSVVERYGKYPRRFALWCGFDYTRLGQPDFTASVIAELERCHRLGATGIGELMDKGRGLGSTSTTLGVHIDDPTMDPVLEACADLRMPVSIHVAEDAWMYEPMDQTNDGLMNGWNWRVAKDPGVLMHDEMIGTLERAVAKHPRTTFIAVHLANCCADLGRLGAMLDKYPNLHADLAARFMELAATPRAVSRFLEKYQDRLLFGADYANAIDVVSIRIIFRLLETADEHFYNPKQMQYHWPLHAWALPDSVLEKIYRGNALKLMAPGG